MARDYKKKTCYAKKSSATKAQKILHGKGFTAQVKKDAKTGKWCLFSAGKRKKKK